jgi:hypothetical protein
MQGRTKRRTIAVDNISKHPASDTTEKPVFGSLDWVYQPGIAPTEQAYRRWTYQNPTATKIPHQFWSYFEQQERKDQANHYAAKVLTNANSNELVEKVRKAIDDALPGYSDRRKQEAAVADYIREKVVPTGQLANAADLVIKMSFCRRDGVIGVFNNGGSHDHVIAWDHKCNLSKLCPDEAHQEGKRLTSNYIPAIDHFLNIARRHTMQFAVFTMPNVALGELYKAKRTMFSDFLKLQKKFPQIKGSLVVQEDPLAMDKKSWNVHLNAIILVDGFLDWKELRKKWGFNIEIYDEKKITEKTIASLERKGIDTNNLTRSLVLEAAFRELAKYTTKLTGGQAHKTFSTHLKSAPPLVEWPPICFVEWWKANHGFRRTRSYGVLYDVYKYRWNTSTMADRRLYLTKAGLDLELAHYKWKQLAKENRDLLRDAMDGRLYRDLSGVTWIGSLHIDRDFRPHVKLTAIDLILEDKSLTEYQRFKAVYPRIMGFTEKIAEP